MLQGVVWELFLGWLEKVPRRQLCKLCKDDKLDKGAVSERVAGR